MKRKVSFSLVVVMMLSFVFNALPVQVANAAVNYVTATRTTSESTLYLKDDKESEVGLTIKGTPPVNVVKPNDILLLLDKSGSMVEDNRFDAMKESASEFLDLVDFSSHEVGVVDYSAKDKVYTKSLSKDKSDLKSYIKNVQMGGGTYTNYAIRSAIEEFKTNGRADAQPVIILLTDGRANQTADTLLAAQEAKDAGIVFYTIALLAPDENPDTSAPNELMKEMATTAHHHHFVLGSVGLIDIYRAIVKEIGVASAYDVKITEQVSPEFEVVEGSYDSNIPKPTYDKDTNTLTWSMLELKDQALDLGYRVKVKEGTKAGTYPVATSSVITYKDFSGKECSYKVPSKSIEVKNAPLTLESITEPKANVAGGENVTIKGTNFRDGATVKFGKVSATNVVVVDENTITATVPAGSQGKCVVTVSNDDKSSATLDFYYEAEPQITAVTPNVGPFEGGTSVKINGANFTSDAKVYFGDQEVDSCKFYSSTYLLVKSPKATAAGAVDITVENGDGTKTVLKDGFTYEPEIIEELEVYSIDVTSGPQEGGTRLTLKGKNIDNGAKVYFGTEEGTIVRYYTSSSLLIDTPSQTSAGKVDVTVENLDGKTATLKEAFEYSEKPAPEVTSISPNTGLEAGGESITITGSNFQSGAKVTFGEKEATVSKQTGSTSINVVAPEGKEGKVDVKVTNPDGKEVTLADGYEYIQESAVVLPAPEVTSISPNTGLETGGNYVVIQGANFQSGVKVTIGGNEAQLANYYSSSKLRIKVPAGTVGQAKVEVENPDGQVAAVDNGYEYTEKPTEPAPEVTSISPNTGLETGGEYVIIQGANFQSGVQVRIDGNEAKVVNRYSASKLRIKVPAGTVGQVKVEVENPDGQIVEVDNGYEYTEKPAEPAPQVDALSVTESYEDGGVYCYITGSYFQSGLKVYFGDEEATLANYYGSTKLRVKVPANTAGTVDVRVENPDGQIGTLENSFTYKELVPEITSLSATSGELTGGEYIYIYGVNFEEGLTVKFGNNEGKVTNYYSSSKIRVSVPASDSAGAVDVTIECPSGKTCKLDDGYTYNEPPVVAAPTLDAITTKGTLATKITEAKANAIVYVNGSDFQGTFTINMYDASGNKVVDQLKTLNCYSSVKGRFRLPSTLATGSYKITIMNSDGQESNAVDFEIV